MFGRERRLRRRYERLLAEGQRSTPEILLHGRERSVPILSAPGEAAPSWVILDGGSPRRVGTREIAALDAMRVLAGYD